jgi:hypothetical protein
MRQLYVDHTAPEFLAQAVRELGFQGLENVGTEKLSQVVRELVVSVPWGHYANALAKPYG